MEERRSNLTKVIKTVLTLIIFGFAVLIFIGNPNSKLVSAKTASNSAAQKSGAAIYREFCLSCHGADGRAKTARGKRKGASDLTKSRISYSRGITIITNGKSRMPDFKDDLSATEIKRVNSFVREFRK